MPNTESVDLNLNAKINRGRIGEVSSQRGHADTTFKPKIKNVVFTQISYRPTTSHSPPRLCDSKAEHQPVVYRCKTSKMNPQQPPYTAYSPGEKSQDYVLTREQHLTVRWELLITCTLCVFNQYVANMPIPAHSDHLCIPLHAVTTILNGITSPPNRVLTPLALAPTKQPNRPKCEEKSINTKLNKLSAGSAPPLVKRNDACYDRSGP